MIGSCWIGPGILKRCYVPLGREAGGPIVAPPGCSGEGSPIVATTARIELLSAERYASAERALQAAYDAVEKVTWPLRRLAEYDPADWQEILDRAPTETDVAEAYSFMDLFDTELDQLKREYDEGMKGLRVLNMARLEARRG